MKNFITRTLAGAVFVAFIVAGICIHAYAFLFVFGLITGLTLWEFYGLLKHFEGAGLKRIVAVLGGVYLFFATFMYANHLVGGSIFLPYLLFLMYVMIAELYDKSSNPIHNWSFTFLAQVYCAGAFSLLNFITSAPDAMGDVSYSYVFALALFVFVWLNDTGAYLVGSTIGKHRLFERISPKKSWEGFWGGLVVAMGSSQLFAHFYPEVSWYNWLGLSVAVVLFATWGDLTESLLKRALGIKDSGTLIPGHGGMLDRFDSVLMAIPAMYIYLELFIRN
ncbi:phosphatidate cytidylyltransferase [Parabacteroides sp. PF5-5]|uniref:phosphatidate cytidylyltransferase n=1 Tax=unclassified Parabacteroides TaxID=2649774 RepID=UPI00247629A5|nr:MULTISPECIES: phosphatidate cytidylyltransferase [unclassified Parabacteroides]MDH6305602.1 phosphatidate cytidylyltransferase [Parabacteroides sp. PH5-39]MDH6316360.1 phosphatidate cytidylyltransferase [Parabacteroides sp. PF5-13]MDH6319843.1 phosphatidate cytidylyltransferase [Parabacteroides sp. PH5-13]MDH6323566.1 phosphatidate cytidylyltransferase [Parabacteroides sp. PH5-8]MDH6327547.1 phosphatidate cytidylyltransferase [Parabacteroides sp. PH5-41]